MAWNRPSEQICIKPRARKKPLLVRFIALFVLLCGCIPLWLMLDNADEKVKSSNCERNAIPDVGKRSSHLRDNHEEYTTDKEPKSFDQIPKPDVEITEEMLKAKKFGRVITWTRKCAESIFKNSTDECLSELLTTVPGDRIIDFTFDEDFENDFKNALKTKIEILNDDPPDVVALKNDVMEARQTVAKLVATGRKAGEVLAEMRNELIEIASYREKHEKNLELMCALAEDADIVRRYVKDCNAQLDEYGARHLDIPETDDELLEMMNECRKIEKEREEREKKDVNK